MLFRPSVQAARKLLVDRRRLIASG